jgi:hypothetical protein
MGVRNCENSRMALAISEPGKPNSFIQASAHFTLQATGSNAERRCHSAKHREEIVA